MPAVTSAVVASNALAQLGDEHGQDAAAERPEEAAEVQRGERRALASLSVPPAIG